MGLPVAYRRTGAGPALVLLHGFAADSRVWLPQLEALGPELDVIAWDAPGAGATPEPTDPFTFEDWADALAGLLDGLDLDRVHLLGLSWGGVLAQMFLARHPGRARSLILADTYAGWAGSLGRETARQRLDRGLVDSELPPAEFARAYLPSMFGAAPPAEAVALLTEVLADRHPAGFRMMAAALAEADTRDLLPWIDVPTLLLWGDKDARSPLATAHAFEAAIPGSRLVVLKGAGHVSNLDRPAEFNASVRAFLEALRPTAVTSAP